jgi:D-glycero-D-manno-heptose 1,7-bisphosphate phosphatase
MPIKTIFLDRDGVINIDINYLHKIDDFTFIDGIFDICEHFEKLGYHIIIVTNQSGIYRNLFTENDYQKLTHWMLDQFRDKGINILDIFHCPHGPKSNCNCRKPKSGMLIEAQVKYDIDMKNSWMIGDKERDILAAHNAGIKNTILLNDPYRKIESNSTARFIISSLTQSKNFIKKNKF